MDITLRTDIAGYFSYRIYRENPDNIIYESPTRKNLIVDSGLKHLYNLSVPDVMRVLDLGNSNIPVLPEDRKLKGASFNNSSIFNDLLAISIDDTFDSENSTAVYTAFFRTKTTSSPTILKEFVIKPDLNTDAFARQVFSPITLQPGDGIEFTYNVYVKYSCAPYNTKLKLYYENKLITDVAGLKGDGLSLDWTSVPSTINNKRWTNIDSNGSTIVAVASGSNAPNAAISNIVYSTDAGQNWLSAGAPRGSTYTINKPLNDVSFGTILNSVGSSVDKYVAVGLSALYTSDTGVVWLSGTPAANVNWTGITIGKSSNTPLFVAVANTGSNRVMTSSNTVNWYIVNSGITNSTNWSAIEYGGNYYVAVADSGTHRIAYSTNGTTWLSATAPALNEWCDIAYNFEKNLYVAVSRNATYSPIMYAYGSDITKWYPARSPYPASWNGITYSNGIFVAVGESTNQPRSIYSSDGINWLPSVPIPSDRVWKAVTFSDNAFVAVASSAGTENYPFARIEVLPRTDTSFDVDARIALLSVRDKIYNQETYMYTLRNFDMPAACSVSPAATTTEELLYSSTLPYNSYVRATTNLISPNTAVSVYKFNSTTGHGSIKNLLITDSILFEGYSAGLWAIELNADSQLTSPTVYTGTLDNLITLTPTEGAITRSISSTIGDIVESELQFNVYHTWGPNRPILVDTTSNISIIPSVTNEVIPSDQDLTPTTSVIETRPFIDIIIPTWTVINTDDYSNGYYSEYVPFKAGIFPNSFEEIGQDCRSSPFTVENLLNFELKSNTILTTGTDSIAVVNKPAVRSGYRYSAGAIISELQTVSYATSAATVDIFNSNQISKTELFNDIIISARNYGVRSNFIEDITLAQVNGNAIMRIIFNKNSNIIPDYANVNTQVIDNVDSSCLDSSSVSYAGPGQSVSTTRYSTIRPI
jgi:hypothetical protein